MTIQETSANGDQNGEDAAAAAAAKPASMALELSTTKHPLQYSWTLWYYKNDRSKSWQDNLKEVVTFGTVEDFWAVYNHIELASHLGPGSDYSVFKVGVKNRRISMRSIVERSYGLNIQ